MSHVFHSSSSPYSSFSAAASTDWLSFLFSSSLIYSFQIALHPPSQSIDSSSVLIEPVQNYLFHHPNRYHQMSDHRHTVYPQSVLQSFVVHRDDNRQMHLT